MQQVNFEPPAAATDDAALPTLTDISWKDRGSHFQPIAAPVFICFENRSPPLSGSPPV